MSSDESLSSEGLKDYKNARDTRVKRVQKKGA